MSGLFFTKSKLLCYGKQIVMLCWDKSHIVFNSLALGDFWKTPGIRNPRKQERHSLPSWEATDLAIGCFNTAGFSLLPTKLGDQSGDIPCSLLWVDLPMTTRWLMFGRSALHRASHSLDHKYWTVLGTITPAFGLLLCLYPASFSKHIIGNWSKD